MKGGRKPTISDDKMSTSSPSCKVCHDPITISSSPSLTSQIFKRRSADWRQLCFLIGSQLPAPFCLTCTGQLSHLLGLVKNFNKIEQELKRGVASFKKKSGLATKIDSKNQTIHKTRLVPKRGGPNPTPPARSKTTAALKIKPPSTTTKRPVRFPLTEPIYPEHDNTLSCNNNQDNTKIIIPVPEQARKINLKIEQIDHDEYDNGNTASIPSPKTPRRNPPKFEQIHHQDDNALSHDNTSTFKKSRRRKAPQKVEHDDDAASLPVPKMSRGRKPSSSKPSIERRFYLGYEYAEINNTLTCLTCGWCTNTVATQNLDKTHIETEHIHDHRCPHCDKKFVSSTGRTKHLEKVCKSLVPCETCGKQVPQEKLGVHAWPHKSPEEADAAVRADCKTALITCPRCGKLFPGMSHFVRHRVCKINWHDDLDTIPASSSDPGVVWCQICGRPLLYEALLPRHEWTHLNASEQNVAIRNGKMPKFQLSQILLENGKISEAQITRWLSTG